MSEYKVESTSYIPHNMERYCNKSFESNQSSSADAIYDGDVSFNLFKVIILIAWTAFNHQILGRGHNHQEI